MSTCFISCLIDTSLKGGIFKKNDRDGLERLFNAASNDLAEATWHNDCGYVDEDDLDHCIDSALCGADDPDEIIHLANSWKNDNDYELRFCLDMLEAKNKVDNENDSEALIDSLLKLCNEDSQYAYRLHKALGNLDGIFNINDDKCVISKYGEVESGCSKWEYTRLVEDVNEHPENWVLMDVPYYD